ncbi:hypothetical protein A4V12_10660 [Streptomyces noursei]|nr:hypothetical protein A4V12_10660 [Streptomyces noursei]
MPRRAVRGRARGRGRVRRHPCAEGAALPGAGALRHLERPAATGRPERRPALEGRFHAEVWPRLAEMKRSMRADLGVGDA